MTDHAPEEHHPEKEAADLTEGEAIDVADRQAPSARVVHEAIRRQGIEELERPAWSLLWSGIVAGVAMGASILAEAVLSINLPEFEGREVLVSFGYTFGFLIVIMGRLQLFTESTVTAILPLTTMPSWASLGRTARLWAIVFAANMIGTFSVALYTHLGGFGVPELREAMIEVSEKIAPMPPMQVMLAGIPSGFLIAAIVWMMPSSAGQRIWIIMLLTWLIALGGFTHVVVGSAEAWLLALNGTIGWGHAAFGYVAPTFVGNVIGGTVLFAFLAHAQVSAEIPD